MMPGGTPRSPLMAQAALDSPTAYVADVVQHAGDACSLACYWNTDPWARLREQELPSPLADTSFQVYLPRASTRPGVSPSADALLLAESARLIPRLSSSSICPSWNAAVAVEMSFVTQVATTVTPSVMSQLPCSTIAAA